MHNREAFLSETKQAFYAFLPLLFEKRVLLIGLDNKDKHQFILKMQEEIKPRIIHLVTKMHEQNKIYEGLSNDQLIKSLSSVVKRYLHEKNDEAILEGINAYHHERVSKGKEKEVFSRIAKWRAEAHHLLNEQNDYTKDDSDNGWDKVNIWIRSNITLTQALSTQMPSFEKATLLSLLGVFLAY